MVLSPKHESLKHALALLVDEVAMELALDVYGFGSTTFQRPDLARGFEPDACFYVQNEARVRGKDKLDLAVDPPPDLIIEIDITSPSLNKFPIFAALGIPEVWRYDGERIGIFVLQAEQYLEQSNSVAFPSISGALLTELLEASQQLRRTEWLRRVRDWARNQPRN